MSSARARLDSETVTNRERFGFCRFGDRRISGGRSCGESLFEGAVEGSGADLDEPMGNGGSRGRGRIGTEFTVSARSDRLSWEFASRMKRAKGGQVRQGHERRNLSDQAKCLRHCA